jgi:3-deoxy-7-phosphoheptulonate synthase
MMRSRLDDVNIKEVTSLQTPEELRACLPPSRAVECSIVSWRTQAQEILNGIDPRLIAVIGPCSIHHVGAAARYARRLAAVAQEVRQTLFVLMRTFFEKPRTSLGWKGLINDPYLDGTFRINEGLLSARKLLLDIAEMKLPMGMEVLNPITPQYLGDLITWAAVGARTAGSQPHRELASGLSMPVGFKNSPSGAVAAAIDAVKCARNPHHFFGVTQSGHMAVYHTTGNRFGHVILRGGERPNYDPAEVQRCSAELRNAGLPANVMIDCSHGNSGKDPRRQPLALESCIRQVLEGDQAICGFMLESNLVEGAQAIPDDAAGVEASRSVTDPCIGWETTRTLLLDVNEKLKKVVVGRRQSYRFLSAID